MSRNRWRFSKSTIAVGIFGLAVGLLAALTALISGKPALGGSMGLVDDWSHQHLIFSNPGTAVEALAQGRFQQWYRIVNDPRYIMQQAKRNHVSTGLPANTQDFASLSSRLAMPVTASSFPIFKDPRNDPRRRAPAPHRDWAVSLGTGTVAENMYPAKFSFNINGTPSCTSDFVVYGLNVASTTGSQANLVALNELYSGSSSTSCTGYTAANPYWAYNATNHSGTIPTSVALSQDGTKVIYVESTSSASYLHVLVWHSADGGTPTASKAPTNTETEVDKCPASASCLVTVSLGSTTTITNSSPFYDYWDDIVYVGDDNGYLYKVTPVLGSGTPALTSLHIVTTEGVDTSVMTGPVYDPSSKYVFVGASNGEVYAVTASSFSAVAGSYQFGDSSCRGGYNNRLTDPPIVDPSNGWVYEYVTADTTPHTAVLQASTAGPFTTTNVVTVGTGDDGCDSSTFFPTHSVEFDNNYYTGTTGSSGTIQYGHIWVCGRETSASAAELWEIPTSTEVSSSYTGSISGVSAVANSAQIDEVTHAQCSPFTEIYNVSTDYLFFGEGLSGGGGFGRLYGWTLGDASSTTEAATEINGSPLTYPTATGGTSGIVIDNISTEAQASSIYFTTLATSTTTCGSTSAYCAIKLTQSALQ